MGTKFGVSVFGTENDYLYFFGKDIKMFCPSWDFDHIPNAINYSFFYKGIKSMVVDYDVYIQDGENRWYCFVNCKPTLVDEYLKRIYPQFESNDSVVSISKLSNLGFYTSYLSRYSMALLTKNRMLFILTHFGKMVNVSLHSQSLKTELDGVFPPDQHLSTSFSNSLFYIYATSPNSQAHYTDREVRLKNLTKDQQYYINILSNLVSELKATSFIGKRELSGKQVNQDTVPFSDVDILTCGHNNIISSHTIDIPPKRVKY